MISADLCWELVKANSCYVVRRGGCEFSSDPKNLMNLNAAKYVSLSSESSFGLAASTKGKLLLTQKSGSKFERFPQSSNQTVSLVRGRKASICAVRNILANSDRADLVDAGVARVCAIFRSQRTPKPLKMKKLRNGKRN
ncbi:hypothetical protein MDAP_001143 [Mitosporidium daphniae]|uniref:Ribosomal eL28/Mak16 domain-containing protein n=1 Tax=Mitosporidium daphniae TaxID=1485682 RepID=A0A098VTK0_9MICR|nr:uncharacterized protein DI09_17p230 [Mitosporidium daphniae]KGG52393.1 hypothetical protein DI09_17p230 [Mitosporidium daphniae]|eukprot:XP_013238820.1 uncharacterized protein DI09_17p230 [Mitosporidium daphniae]